MERPDIVTAIDVYMAKQIKLWATKSNRASQIGDPCIRKLVYYRLYPDLQELPSVDLQYIFNEGNIQEQALLKTMAEAGYPVQETQRDFWDARYELSGHIDGIISFNGSRYPLEIKSMNPHIWDAVNSIEDLQKYPWTAKYPAQLNCYMFLMSLEPACMILKNKSTGRIKQLWFDLDYEYTESLLKKCEAINKHVKEGKLPDRNLSEDCEKCPFKTDCCTESLGLTPLDFIDNVKLEASIDHWNMLKDYHTEYSRLDKDIKAKLRGIEKAVIGKYLIQGKKIEKGWKVSINELANKEAA